MRVFVEAARVAPVTEFTVELDARLEGFRDTPAVTRRVFHFRLGAARKFALGQQVDGQHRA